MDDRSRKQVKEEHRANQQAHDCLLVLGVRPRSEPGAQLRDELAGCRHQRSVGGSCHSRWICAPSGLMPRKASTMPGAKCRPACEVMYSKARSSAQAALEGRTY